jgi:hypothetical protein
MANQAQRTRRNDRTRARAVRVRLPERERLLGRCRRVAMQAHCRRKLQVAVQSANQKMRRRLDRTTEASPVMRRRAVPTT